MPKTRVKFPDTVYSTFGRYSGEVGGDDRYDYDESMDGLDDGDVVAVYKLVGVNVIKLKTTTELIPVEPKRKRKSK